MAVEDYKKAQKMGQRNFRACVSKGQYPYLQVLDDILENTFASTVNFNYNTFSPCLMGNLVTDIPGLFLSSNCTSCFLSLLNFNLWKVNMRVCLFLFISSKRNRHDRIRWHWVNKFQIFIFNFINKA